MVVVSLRLHMDMCSSWKTQCPGCVSAAWLTAVTTLFWYLQSVLLAAVIVLEIAKLRASSETCFDMLVNTIAATFTIELDELFFGACPPTRRSTHTIVGLTSGKNPAHSSMECST